MTAGLSCIRRARCRASDVRFVAAAIVAVVIVAVVMSAAPFASSVNRVTAAPIPVSRYSRLLPGLCRARQQSAQGQYKQVGITYGDQAHIPLHLLFAEMAKRDRRLAARLGTAHARVEQDIDRHTPSLTPDLDRLITLTAQSLTAVGVAALPCAP